MAIVVISHTIGDPWAVMIHFEYTTSAIAAMMGTWRFVVFALLAIAWTCHTRVCSRKLLTLPPCAVVVLKRRIGRFLKKRKESPWASLCNREYNAYPTGRHFTGISRACQIIVIVNHEHQQVEWNEQFSCSGWPPLHGWQQNKQLWWISDGGNEQRDASDKDPTRYGFQHDGEEGGGVVEEKKREEAVVVVVADVIGGRMRVTRRVKDKGQHFPNSVGGFAFVYKHGNSSNPDPLYSFLDWILRLLPYISSLSIQLLLLTMTLMLLFNAPYYTPIHHVRWKKKKLSVRITSLSHQSLLSFPPHTNTSMYIFVMMMMMRWWWLNYPCHNPFNIPLFPFLSPLPYMNYQYSQRIWWMVVHWETLFLGFRIIVPIKNGANAQVMQASARLLRQICSQFDTKSSLVTVPPT